ncbi:MAG: beta-glucosidase [Alphaproteobacteria bacterium]|nr:beta-glucosidase [Alphaproteobacteria bacterium]
METSGQRRKIFKSFIMGGFESACHINNAGRRVDMIAASQHDTQLLHDYDLLREQGIYTIREGIRWPLMEKDGALDFSLLEPTVIAARDKGMQVIWTLCHYGWPDGLDVFSPEFITRFADYARQVAVFIKERSDDVPLYSPMNEISFLSWAAAEVGWIHPYTKNRGGELKRQLIKAVIAAMDAIWAVDARARFVHVDPVINIVAPKDHPEKAAEAAFYNDLQYEASDMLTGAIEPELGGAEKYLDIMGANFYHDNQWEHHGERIDWNQNPRDPRYVPLNVLLENVYKRYQRPIFLGETSHVGGFRPAWMHEVTDEILKLQEKNIPFEGICLYPIIDRHDWENPNHWHNSGLWDFKFETDGTYTRVIFDKYAAEVQRAREMLEK